MGHFWHIKITRQKSCQPIAVKIGMRQGPEQALLMCRFQISNVNRKCLSYLIYLPATGASTCQIYAVRRGSELEILVRKVAVQSQKSCYQSTENPTLDPRFFFNQSTRNALLYSSKSGNSERVVTFMTMFTPSFIKSLDLLPIMS